MDDELIGPEINGEEDLNNENGGDLSNGEVLPRSLHLSGMYKNWFLDYASYVILERAVPDLADGLKPVHRRLMHSMKELDDGRFNKAANIIGHTMKYHPHGDASIGDALVQLGQKDLLVETQGNWGSIYTGDSAAAPRYIEARLSKLALEIVFNPKTTKWQLSYDGRNKEPVALPVKFPLLLAQGVEGIAVGLTSKILPHNFIELIDASIHYLKGEDFEIFPDFPTAGMADFSKYNDGARGSRVRVRARISQLDKKTLVINEIAFGSTTTSLIESVVAANDKGKIKIKKIEDNTAEKVEILIHLAPGVSPDTTIDALYAFTSCEVSISPVCCVIDEQKPRFLSVKDLLAKSADRTLELLKTELEIQKSECLEQLHFASLERIFIEKEIYLRIRKSKTDKEINDTIFDGLKPYIEDFYREVTAEDVHKLRKIPIDRISKYNSDKAEDVINALLDDIKQIEFDLDHLVDYAIAYYQRIRNKFGKGRERKTEIRNFDVIQATMVAAATQKLYVNREEGFAGTGMKRDEFVCECSDIDDIIVFRADGNFIVTKVSDKVFVGKNIIYINVFKKNDERTIYNMVYMDGRRGNAMVKRFAVTGVNRDKEYSLTKGSADSRVIYFTANPNGEAEIITVHHKPKPRLKILHFDFDFTTLTIKGRSSYGNILTKHGVKKITLKDEGVSTLSARDIWFDDSVNRLNAEQRGRLLGAFEPEDKIVAFMRSGHFRVFNCDLSLHFDEDLFLIEKYQPEKTYTTIYLDGENGFVFVKRFPAEDTGKKTCFISEAEGSSMMHFSEHPYPSAELSFELKNARSKASETLQLDEFIGVKSFKAKGRRLSSGIIKEIRIIEPALPEDEEIVEVTVDENEGSSSADETVVSQDIIIAEEISVENPENEPGTSTTPDEEPVEEIDTPSEVHQSQNDLPEKKTHKKVAKTKAKKTPENQPPKDKPEPGDTLQFEFEF